MKLMAYRLDSDADETYAVDALYLDGYMIGDTILEGLPIKIELDETGDLKITADWPKGLNVAFWTKQAKDYAREADMLSTTPELKDDDGFIAD